MPKYDERPVHQPSYSTPQEAQQAMASFLANHSRPEALKLIALGYGPFGAKDPNFNQEFRRRYYLTEEQLRFRFESLLRDGEGPDLHHSLDDLKRDLQWYLRSRHDVQDDE